MTGMRLLGLGLLLLLLPACIGGPFDRGVYDNRPAERVPVVSATDEGVFELGDGRRVRLFGVAPQDEATREQWGRHFADTVGHEVTVEEGLMREGALPAVELVLWREHGYCGHATGSWDPWAHPIGTWSGHPLASNLAIAETTRLVDADLDHPDANLRLVEALRVGQDYGFRYRAGLSP